MTEQNHISRIWDIVEKTRIGMLTTQFGGGLRARPLEARADREAGIIWFVTDVRGTKDDEIEAAHEIGLVFIDAGDRAYLSITGRAFVTRATARTKEIWKKTDDSWFAGGLADPNVRVLRIEPIAAELWDGPSSAAVVAFEFAKK
jgi:general stress protein 26